MIKSISTDKAPQAIGPYSQAIAVGDLVFCSGQVGIDPTTGELKKDLQTQVDQIFKNLIEVLKAANSNLDFVLKTTVYLANIADFAEMNEIYAKYFVDNKPARATIEVAALPKGALVEIDAIALRKKECCGNCNKKK